MTAKQRLDLREGLGWYLRRRFMGYSLVSLDEDSYTYLLVIAQETVMNLHLGDKGAFAWRAVEYLQGRKDEVEMLLAIYVLMILLEDE